MASVDFETAKARCDRALAWVRELEAAIEDKKAGRRQSATMSELQDELELAQSNYVWMIQHASDPDVDWEA